MGLGWITWQRRHTNILTLTTGHYADDDEVDHNDDDDADDDEGDHNDDDKGGDELSEILKQQRQLSFR